MLDITRFLLLRINQTKLDYTPIRQYRCSDRRHHRVVLSGVDFGLRGLGRVLRVVDVVLPRWVVEAGEEVLPVVVALEIRSLHVVHRAHHVWLEGVLLLHLRDGGVVEGTALALDAFEELRYLLVLLGVLHDLLLLLGSLQYDDLLDVFVLAICLYLFGEFLRLRQLLISEQRRT